MQRRRKAGLAVDLADGARRDLGDIDRWTRDRFGAAVAQQYARHVVALLERVATSPSDWASRPEPGWSPDVRTMSIRIIFRRGQHRVIYRVEPRRIVVLRFVHLASAQSGATEPLDD